MLVMYFAGSGIAIITIQVGGAGTTMQFLLVIIAFNCLVLKRYVRVAALS